MNEWLHIVYVDGVEYNRLYAPPVIHDVLAAHEFRIKFLGNYLHNEKREVIYMFRTPLNALRPKK